MKKMIVLTVLSGAISCSSDGGKGGTGPAGSDGGTAGVSGGSGGAGVAGGSPGGSNTSGGAPSGGTSGSGGGSSGGTANGGTSGSPPVGGAANGGVSGGGGAAGSGGFDTSGACSPGIYYDYGKFHAAAAYGGLAIRCQGTEYDQAVQNGLGDGVNYVPIDSIHLVYPMTPGKTSSISIELENNPPGPAPNTVEYWAAETECGATGKVERFYTAPVNATGVYCGSITPTIAYPYILQVIRSDLTSTSTVGTQEHGTTVCMMGTCPSP